MCVSDLSDRLDLRLTGAGEGLYQVYTADYFSSVSEKLSEISDEDTAQMIRTIRRIHKFMRG